jgi:aminoethylphosphonate catabolism LysR family transcriptional regulator
VRLFDRTPRGVVPTTLGVSLLAITRPLFALTEEADELLSASRELAGGRLEVGADGPHHISPVMATFARRYPGIELSLNMGTADRVLRELRAFRIDVALVARVDADERLYSQAFARSPLVLFVPRDHAWARRASVRLQEVSGERLILREAASVTRQLFERALHEAGVRPGAVMQIESREAVREAVAAGLGIGVVAAAEFHRDPRLKALRIRNVSLEIVEHVVCLAERQRLRIVRAFLDLAAELAES